MYALKTRKCLPLTNNIYSNIKRTIIRGTVTDSILFSIDKDGDWDCKYKFDSTKNESGGFFTKTFQNMSYRIDLNSHTLRYMKERNRLKHIKLIHPWVHYEFN